LNKTGYFRIMVSLKSVNFVVVVSQISCSRARVGMIPRHSLTAVQLRSDFARSRVEALTRHPRDPSQEGGRVLSQILLKGSPQQSQSLPTSAVTDLSPAGPSAILQSSSSRRPRARCN